MISWFITTYLEDLTAKPHPRRWCAMDTYTPQIFTDGGSWEEIEVGKNHAIVKVKASLAIIQTIAQDSNFTQIPFTLLTDSLSSLTTAQKTKIQKLLNNMGYTNQEIQATLGGDLGQKALKDLLQFAVTRRIPPRFDITLQKIVFDQPAVTCSNDLIGVDRRIQ